MSVDTNIDEEILLFHDFEHEVPCDFIDSEKCGNPAEWRLVRRCCGFVSLLCSPCKEEDRKWLEDWTKIGEVTCIQCLNKVALTKQSDAYTIIERL